MFTALKAIIGFRISCISLLSCLGLWRLRLWTSQRIPADSGVTILLGRSIENRTPTADEVRTGQRCRSNGDWTTLRFIMSTNVKAQRPTRLSEDETLTSFEDWKNNLIFYLNQEIAFIPFLKTDATWTKTSSSTSNRGLADEAALRSLENFSESLPVSPLHYSMGT